MSRPTLHPFQHAANSAIVAAIDGGLRRLLEKMPTGTGKTVTFARLPDYLAPWLAQFKPTERRMLVIAHREELLTQACAKIQAANPGLTVMIEQGDLVASPYADVVVASIQTLSAMKFRRLQRLMSRMVFRVVVVDEAHHAAAKTYRTVLAMLGFLPLRSDQSVDDTQIEAASYNDVAAMEAELKNWDAIAPKDRVLIGVTATPNRSDAIGLGCVFQDIVFNYGLRQAIKDGWLVPPVPYIIETTTSLDEVRTTAGEFNQRDLARAVNIAERNDVAVKGWLEVAKGLPTLTFTVDVQHAHDLADNFQTVGVRAVALSGETPKDDRATMLRQYTEGQIDMICNCMVLTEGTDLPRTACILHAKPTKSATLYEQMTGRGLRLFPDKVSCIVIDIVDIAKRHSLQVAPTLYGLPPGLKGKGETLEELSDEWDDLREQYPQLSDLLDKRRTIEELRIVAKTFDIWSVPDLGSFGDVVSMNWLKTGDDIYQLQYPWNDATEVIQVAPDILGKWEVSCTMRPRDGSPVRQRTIAHGVIDQQSAASLAEIFIAQERRNVMKLKDKSAPWRTVGASDKQLATLKKMRVPHDPATISKGQASDLLDMAFSRYKPKGASR